ncbi:MAG: HypC/HybG/HupF family hydrogenase formation chaperone [Firmicutes bacterium]|nr:HypC/HybG/HupF family hydrogenase formation chaperone [Bacillota bacterium]
MCLAIPGLVVEMQGKDWAVIEVSGIRRTVGVQLVEGVKTGDYLMVHAGYAVEKLDLIEAEARIELWEELLQFEGSE